MIGSIFKSVIVSLAPAVIGNENSRILKAAYITYILPILLMIAFYAVPFSQEGARILSSFAGLMAGGVICWLYSRRLAKDKQTRAVIISIINN